MACCHEFGVWCSECIAALVREHNDLRKKVSEYEAVLQDIKSLSKTIPAAHWTPEFREVANRVHSILREHAYVNCFNGSSQRE